MADQHQQKASVMTDFFKALYSVNANDAEALEKAAVTAAASAHASSPAALMDVENAVLHAAEVAPVGPDGLLDASAIAATAVDRLVSEGSVDKFDVTLSATRQDLLAEPLDLSH